MKIFWDVYISGSSLSSCSYIFQSYFGYFGKKFKNLFFLDILVVGHFTSKNFFLEDFTYFWILYLIELAEWILLSFFGTLYWIFCLFLSYIWLSKAPISHTFLGVGIGGRASITIPPPSPAREGNIFQAPISNIKRFPFQCFLFQFSFSFLLLVSTLYISFDIELWSW